MADSLESGCGLGLVVVLALRIDLFLLRTLHRANAIVRRRQRARRAFHVRAVAVDADVRAVAADGLVPPQHSSTADLVFLLSFVDVSCTAVLPDQCLAERRVGRE